MQVENTGMTLDLLADSGSFATLDAKLAAAIRKIIQGDLNHKINLISEEKAKAGTMMIGRQMLLKVYEQYSISDVEGALLSFEDLLQVQLHQDDLRNFLADWENVLSAIKARPDDTIPETLFKKDQQKCFSA